MPPAITSWIANLPMPYLNPPLLIIYQVIPVVGVSLGLTRYFHLKLRFLCPSNYSLSALSQKVCLSNLVVFTFPLNSVQLLLILQDSLTNYYSNQRKNFKVDRFLVEFSWLTLITSKFFLKLTCSS